MILNVRRRSGFPIVLTDLELTILDQMENDGLYQQLEDYERQLRHCDDLKEIKVEAIKIEEIVLFVNSLNHKGPVIFDFARSLVILDDVGGIDC